MQENGIRIYVGVEDLVGVGELEDVLRLVSFLAGTVLQSQELVRFGVEYDGTIGRITALWIVVHTDQLLNERLIDKR